MKAIAAIKTLTDESMKWEEISSCLIDEVKNLKSNHRHSRANTANTACEICGKANHPKRRCFFNPLNTHNKLGLTSNIAEKTQEGKTNDDKDENRTPKKKKIRIRNAPQWGMWIIAVTKPWIV